jgi:hypothetical protein
LFDLLLHALVSLQDIRAILQVQQEFLALLVHMALLLVYACLALEVLLAFSLVLQALQCARPVLQVSLALQAPQSTPLFARQAPIAWPIAALLRVMQESFAQQERNLFRTTMPPALQVCTALLVLHLFAALLVPTHP